MSYQISLFEPRPKPKSETFDFPKSTFTFWPCAYGVKSAAGEWLCLYVGNRKATEVFENDPHARELIVGLDPLEGLEERPGVVERVR